MIRLPRSTRPHRPSALSAWVRQGRLLLAALLLAPVLALAQFVVLTHEQVRITPANQLVLDADLRFELPTQFDRVLRAAVPLVFIAEAQVYARRWYWRDERIASSQRSWKLLYQPLTNTWRVSSGASSESYADLNSALVAVSRLDGWVLAGKAQLDKADGRRLYVDLTYRLDTAQLPPLLLLGSGSPARWDVGVQQKLDVDQ